MKRILIPLTVILVTGLNVLAQQKTVNIVTVNNPDMITLRKRSTKFAPASHTSRLNWLVLEENIMRQRITTDVSTGGGQFDVIFIGLYETPIFAKRGWLTAMENLPAEYDLEDVFKSLRDGLSYDGKLYALPFNGESSMLMYRKDLFEAKGITMPEQATYGDIKKWAEQLSDKGKGIYGITLRGKPGWGENMAFFSTLVNTFGGAYFDMDWHATIDTPEWKNALTYYVDLMKAYGPPGATSNGFNENLTIFATGKAAMWIDATSGAGPLFDPKESQVSDKVAFANAPIEKTPNGSHWLWSWAFAIPKSSKAVEDAKKFALWATSKEYAKLVAQETGWATVPPGTRKSLYDNAEYQKAAPFAAVTLKAMQTADPTNPAIRPLPYTGVQFVGIPEFQSFGTVIGQNVAGALAGKMTVDAALKASQAAANKAVIQAGLQKK